jgi:hypothetical protein
MKCDFARTEWSREENAELWWADMQPNNTPCLWDAGTFGWRV